MTSADNTIHRSSHRTTDRPVAAVTGGGGAAAVRVVFGLFWAVDAGFKWTRGFRHGYLGDLKDAAMGQPSWLHGWFSFWIDRQSAHPGAFAVAVAVLETVVALSVLLGFARVITYPLGIVLSVAIWGIGEGFGGPYDATSTDIGTAIVYALLFAALIAAAPRGTRDRFSVDGALARVNPRWSRVADFVATTPRA